MFLAWPLRARRPAEALRTPDEGGTETCCASRRVLTFELPFSMSINLPFTGSYDLNVNIDIGKGDYECGNA